MTVQTPCGVLLQFLHFSEIWEMVTFNKTSVQVSEEEGLVHLHYKSMIFNTVSNACD